MPQDHSDSSKRRFTTAQIVRGVLSFAVVVGIFVYGLPKIANFSQVWTEIRAMSLLEIGGLVLISLWNIATYWFVMVASLPGLNYGQAMKVNQASTAIANTLPGGGALGVGVSYAMYTGYGFSPGEIGRSVLISGIWNNFVKLGMPVIALALLAVRGEASGSLTTAALIGLAVLIGAIVLFALILRSERLAHAIGFRAGKIASAVLRVVRRGPVEGWGDAFKRFRTDTIDLLATRWASLTVATIVSHSSLYLVLLVSLRHVGVSEAEVNWVQVLAAFSFIRLVSALPITPGGLGLVELGLTAALIAAGGNDAQVVAAVLVYRAVTYVLPIPLGVVAYLMWRKGAGRRAELREAAARAAAAVADVGGSS